jgi:hypothetical protein
MATWALKAAVNLRFVRFIALVKLRGLNLTPGSKTGE